MRILGSVAFGLFHHHSLGNGDKGIEPAIFLVAVVGEPAVDLDVGVLLVVGNAYKTGEQPEHDQSRKQVEGIPADRISLTLPGHREGKQAQGRQGKARALKHAPVDDVVVVAAHRQGGSQNHHVRGKDGSELEQVQEVLSQADEVDRNDADGGTRPAAPEQQVQNGNEAQDDDGFHELILRSHSECPVAVRALQRPHRQVGNHQDDTQLAHGMPEQALTARTGLPHHQATIPMGNDGG